ncbi:MAG TPA: hypothetical protein VI074_12090 [Propionibacteriaceae bacterium]
MKQYKVIYRDGSEQIITAARHSIARGTVIFFREDGSQVSIMAFSEVRSITELEESPVNIR